MNHNLANNNNRKKKTSKVSDAAISYNGPARTPSSLDDSIVVTLQEMTIENTQTTSTDGQIILSDPVTSYDWSSWAALYKEFRVLSLQATWVPIWEGASVRTFTGVYYPSTPLHSIIDHSNDFTLTTPSNMAGYSSFELSPINQRKTRTIKMLSAEQADFIETASPVSKMNIQFSYTGAGSTSSQELAHVLIYRVIQFRTKA